MQMAGMVQASTNADSTTDTGLAGTVLAAETIATAAVLKATAAAATAPMGEGFKPRDEDATEPRT
jgi:hypothetical protein